jgi:hypothetical protein
MFLALITSARLRALQRCDIHLYRTVLELIRKHKYLLSQHKRPLQRVEVKADDVLDLNGKVGIRRDPETFDEMRCSAQMRCTLVWLMPISLAMVRTLQCVALTGRSFTVFSTTLSLIAALIGSRPGGLERPFTSPSTPASAKYSCQRHTVVLETPTSRMIAMTP